MGFPEMKPNGYKFRRQHPFSKYILDFYCHKAKLAIEIDGPYHDYPEQKKLDRERTAHIHEWGVEELRFSNEMILLDLKTVKSSILSRLR